MVPRFRSCQLGLVIAAYLAGTAHALDAWRAITPYCHSSWQTHEGLPQNTVRAVAQTADGYLWAGTEAGLVRFDGAQFRIFDRSSHDEIFDNHHIYALAADPDGSLWIGTNGGGLLQLVDDELRHFGEADGLPAGRVTALARARGRDRGPPALSLKRRIAQETHRQAASALLSCRPPSAARPGRA